METEAQSKKEAAHLAEPAGGKAERQTGTMTQPPGQTRPQHRHRGR